MISSEKKELPLIVRLVLYLSVLQIPFTNIPLPFMQSRSVQSITEIIVLLMVLIFLRNFIQSMAWPLLAVWILLTLRVLWGVLFSPDYFEQWWMTSRSWFRPLLWGWFLLGALRSPDVRSRALWFYLVACGASVLLKAMGFGGDVVFGTEDMMRSSAFGQNANELGLVYAMGCIIATAKIIDYLQKIKSAFLTVLPLIFGAACVWGMFQTASRTAMIACLIGMLTLSFTKGTFISLAIRTFGITVLLCLVGYAAIHSLSILNRFEEIKKSGIEKNDRVQQMKEYAGEFLKAPLLGVGPEKYKGDGNINSMLKGGFYGKGITIHNALLLVAVEMGMVGLIPFCASLFGIAWAALKCRKYDGMLAAAMVFPMIVVGMTSGMVMYYWPFYFAASYALAANAHKAGMTLPHFRARSRRGSRVKFAFRGRELREDKAQFV